MKKIVLKIAWAIVASLALLASCVRMDSNIIRVHAEEVEPTSDILDDLAEWGPYLDAMQNILDVATGSMSKTNAIVTGIEIAIANTIPLAVSTDITVFNGVTEIIGDYNYIDEDGDTTYHLCHIGGNSRIIIEEAGYQYNLVTYPSGSTAFAQFGETGRIWLYPNNSDIDITGSGFSGFGYTVPNSTTTKGFSIWYGGGSPASTLQKSYYNDVHPDVLCGHWASCFGYDFVQQYNDIFGTEHAFLLPQVDENMANYMDTNDYLNEIYKKFELDFGMPFVFTFPDLVPTGTLMPDGTIKVDPDLPDPDLPDPDLPNPDFNVNVDVNVEFPTYDVPDNSEPDTFPLETVPEITEHETNEIPDDVFLGFDFWWNSALALISLFDVWDVLMVILWVSLICFLLWR